MERINQQLSHKLLNEFRPTAKKLLKIQNNNLEQGFPNWGTLD